MQIKRMENRLWLAVLLLAAALSLAGCGMSAGNGGVQLSQEQVDGLEKLGKIKVISSDDIVVIVNKDNPLTNITLEQLKGIYTGELAGWQELSGK